jgi:hypothetical protein
MPDQQDQLFHQDRRAAFDKVIAFVSSRAQKISPQILLTYTELSPENLQEAARKEAWALFMNGITHLKEGAPGGQPGSVSEALSRTSLRASPFAAGLGVKPPQFEQLFFSIDYTNGHEAALFFCQKLAEAAENDIPKSRQVIQQKILAEKQPEFLKLHMGATCDALVENYIRCCQDLKSGLPLIH